MSELNNLPTFKEAVYLVLDGEATHQQEKQLMQFIATSTWHRNYFENEKQLHMLIKKSITSHSAPIDLAESIQAKLQEEILQHQKQTTGKYSYAHFFNKKTPFYNY